MEVVSVKPTAAADVAPMLRDSIEAGADRVVLAGGDGLIHQSLAALIDPSTPVGIVACGTGNDFARGIGLQRRGLRSDLERRIEVALTAPTSGVDLIEARINGSSIDGSAIDEEGSVRFAASVVTGGFSVAVNARADRMSWPRGSSRYTLATLAALPRLRSSSLRFLLDGDVVHEEISLAAVANAPYFGGGMAICPDASVDDGRLDVALVSSTSRLTLAAVLPLAFIGQHTRHPAVTVRRVSAIEIPEGLELWADGEPFCSGAEGPVTLTARPLLQVAGAGLDMPRRIK